MKIFPSTMRKRLTINARHRERSATALPVHTNRLRLPIPDGLRIPLFPESINSAWLWDEMLISELKEIFHGDTEKNLDLTLILPACLQIGAGR
jgi:hypothetical protein